MQPVVPHSYNFHRSDAEYIIDHCDGCGMSIMPREERWIAETNFLNRTETVRCGSCYFQMLSRLSAVAVITGQFKEQDAKKAKDAASRKREGATERVYVPKADERCAAAPVENSSKPVVSPPLYEGYE